MDSYTINGETYYVAENSLYTEMDETHGIEEIDDHAVHLLTSEETGEKYLARLEWGGSIYSSVEVVPLDDDGPPKQWIPSDEFGEVTPVQLVRPDDVHECPECGEWAGRGESPKCPHCGHGLD